LDKNRIKLLGGLDKLTRLEELWLSGNLVESFEEVSTLRQFSHLDTLVLQHNPVYHDSQYRNKVLALLPHIRQLDALPVLSGRNPLALA
jgi:hypothetical protein